MTSPAVRFSNDAALLLELTGAPQAWLVLCQEVIALRGAPAALALLEDDTGPWARALRTGRKARESGAELALDPEILDVRAAKALRRLTLYLAGKTDESAADALDPILAHADDAQLHGTDGCDLDRLLRYLRGVGSPHPELTQVLEHLHGSPRPSASFIALLACHLTRSLPVPDRPDISVPVLFDNTSRDGLTGFHPGVAGKLSLTYLEQGPPGLHPDPRRMSFFYSPTPPFVASLENAWQASPLADTSASVCWAVTLEVRAEGPANTIEGGSLGGAFGLALHELDTRRRRRVHLTHIPGLSRFYLDFRRRISNPRAAVTATVLDSDGNLGPVRGLDNKVAAARRAHVDCVIAHPQAISGVHEDSGVAVETALTVGDAIRVARTGTNPRFFRTIMVVVVVGVFLVMAAVSTGLLVSNNQRQQQRVAAAQVFQEAGKVRRTNSRLALQLGAAAVALDPSPTHRAGLAETLANNHYAGHVTEADGVTALATSRSGSLLASATEGNQLTLWRLNTSGRPARLGTVNTTSAVRTIAFTPDEHTLITGDTSNCLVAWDVKGQGSPTQLAWRDPSPLHRCGAPDPPDIDAAKVQSLAVSGDGRLLASASSDGTLSLFDLRVPSTPRRVSRMNIGNAAWSVAFHPHREVAVTGRRDGTVTSWSIRDPGQPRRLAEIKDEHTDIVRSIAFSPTGDRFVTASLDRTLKVWGAADTRQLRVLDTLTGHSGPIFQVAYAANGKTFVSASADRTAMVWDAESHQLATKLRGQDGYLRALASVPGSERVVTGSLDETIVTWQLAAPSQVPIVAPVAREKSDVLALAFNPDRSKFATGTLGGEVHIYDVADPAHPVALPNAQGWVYSLAFSSDGKLADAGESPETVRVWDVRTRTPQPLWSLPHNTYAVYSVAFDPSGQVLATGNAEGAVALWRPHDDATAPTSTGRVSEQEVTTLTFSDQGRLLVSGGLDKAVTMWPTTQPGQMDPVGRIEDNDEAIYAVGYSRHRGLLAVSSADGSTSIWATAKDPRQPSRLSKIIREDYTRRIRAEAFSTDDGLLATGGDQGTVEIFAITDPNNPLLLATIPVVEPVPTVDGKGVLALAYGSRALAVGAGDGTVRLFDMSRLEDIQRIPKEIACSLTTDGLSQKAWAEYIPEVPYRATCP